MARYDDRAIWAIMILITDRRKGVKFAAKSSSLSLGSASSESMKHSVAPASAVMVSPVRRSGLSSSLACLRGRRSGAVTGAATP
eukprot:COSAG06_NODE_4138_length_4534_cov_1.863811_3_plen_84_part_00